MASPASGSTCKFAQQKSCVESERYIIRTKNVIEGQFIISYHDLSVIAARHEMPIGDDRAPVQTQAESRKNGRIARREAPDKSGQDTINRPSITFTVKTCIS